MRQRQWQCPFQNLVNTPLPSMNRLSHPVVRRRIHQLFVERATCGKFGHGYHLVAECRPGAPQSWLYAVCGKDHFRDCFHWQLAKGFRFDMPQFVLRPCPEESDDAAPARP